MELKELILVLIVLGFVTYALGKSLIEIAVAFFGLALMWFSDRDGVGAIGCLLLLLGLLGFIMLVAGIVAALKLW